MAEYSYVRCLFCNTGKEHSVVRAIHEKGWGRALFPQRIKTIRQGPEWINVNAPLLPGYVFVYSDQESTVQRDELLHLRHVIRVLSYGEGEQDQLTGKDRAFADWLWRFDGNIGVMQAMQIGDRIEIVDGVFRQLHGTVARMDRRRRTICVELDTTSVIRHIWLAYNIVERLDGENTADKTPVGEMK